jgi:NADH:ubiquinone oxidoreductase subunit 3 (subunit A)
MGDILIIGIILIVAGLLLLKLFSLIRPSRRDELATEIYNLNQPMTWEDAQKEADFWLDYWAK